MNFETHKPKFLVLAIGLLGIFFSVFSAKPWFGAYQNLSNEVNQSDAQKAVYAKKANLFDNMHEFDPLSHEGKTVFRLTVPAIMKIFNLSYADSYVLQIALGMLLHIMLAFLLFGITGSYVSTILMSIAFSCTYFGRSYFTDTYISYDTYAYFFIALAILCRNKPLLLVTSVIALFFTDERGILAIPVIWLCIKLLDRKDPQNIKWKELFSFKDNSVYVLTAVIICAVIRLILRFGYNLAVPTGNLSIGYFFLNYKGVQLGIWSGIACCWGLVLLTIALSVYRKQLLFALLISVVAFPIIFVAALVADRTKSIAYLLPVILICVHYLYCNTTRGEFNKLAFMVMAGNLLYPMCVNPVPLDNLQGGVYFYPYIFDILFKIANAAHGVFH